MSQQFTKTAAVLLALLASTALSPAYAQTAPSATPPTAPPQPSAGTPPSSGIVVLVDPSMKPPATAARSTSPSSKAADRAAFFEAHLAALHVGLTLTSDQEKLWPPVEQAIRTMANIKVETREAVKNVLEPQDDESEAGRSNGASDPSLETDPFLAVKAASVLLMERGKALQSLADASGPLYGSLSTDQKGRLPVLVRSFAPNNFKLRQFLSLLTLDATVPPPASRGGRRGWSREEQESGGPAMQPGKRQGWYGRHQLDGGDMDEGPGQGEAYGDPDAQHGYGMMQPRADGETPNDSDE